ncbi:MAG: PilZ domain-containing protein, partial [Gammaproteobacteria bacterium]|nr:PilZ domain-containing protein [Gammaproteobacteria bacterium]
AEKRWLLGIEFSDVGDTALARIRSLVQPTGEWN